MCIWIIIIIEMREKIFWKENWRWRNEREWLESRYFYFVHVYKGRKNEISSTSLVTNLVHLRFKNEFRLYLYNYLTFISDYFVLNFSNSQGKQILKASLNFCCHKRLLKVYKTLNNRIFNGSLTKSSK